MIDPVKKHEELQSLTEGVFSGLWNKLNSPPSATLPSSVHADNAKKYQAMYGTHYIIKGSPKNRYYDASDLIQLYKNGQIKNNTEIKIVNGKKTYFPFINLLKREPFASKLKDFFVQDNDKPNANISYAFAFPVTPKTGNPYYKTVKTTIPAIAKFIIKNPALDKILNVYDPASEKYVSAMSSALWPEINSWINHLKVSP